MDTRFTLFFCFIIVIVEKEDRKMNQKLGRIYIDEDISCQISIIPYQKLIRTIVGAKLGERHGV